jgi:hypothetical protein
MFRPWCVAFSGLFWLASCASVSVIDLQQSETQPSQPPPQILVADFGIQPAEWKVDREGTELKDFQLGMQFFLADAIATRINKHVAECKRWDGRQPLPTNAWLVRGRFLRVEQGSRLLRATIGFGAGGTKLETFVEIVDLRTTPPTAFMKFDTTGGTNAEPGAIANIDPVSAGVSLAVQSLGGLSSDAERTARMITASVSEYWSGRGWPLRGPPLEAKKGTFTQERPPGAQPFVPPKGDRRPGRGP